MQMKEDDWDAVIDTNLTSIFRVSKAFQRGMQKARWGRCVTSYIFPIVTCDGGREVSRVMEDVKSPWIQQGNTNVGFWVFLPHVL